MTIINRVGNKLGTWSFRLAQKDIAGQENRNLDTKKEGAEWSQVPGDGSNKPDAGLLEIIDKQKASKIIV